MHFLIPASSLSCAHYEIKFRILWINCNIQFLLQIFAFLSFFSTAKIMFPELLKHLVFSIGQEILLSGLSPRYLRILPQFLHPYISKEQYKHLGWFVLSLGSLLL